MNNRKQNTILWRLIINFFNITYNKWIIVATTTSLLVIYFYFINLKDVSVFPSNKNFTYYSYTDSANGGHSQVKDYQVTDSLISIEFDLNEGFSSPYIGISITPKNGNPLNLQFYNRLMLQTEGEGVKSLGISLFTTNKYEKDGLNGSPLCLNANLEIASTKKQYSINLEQFRVPDWWRDANNLSTDEWINPDLKNVFHLNIGTAYNPVIGKNHTLKIYSITFQRNNSELVKLLLLSELAVILLLIIANYVQIKLFNQTVPLTIAYKAIEIENEKHELEDFMKYINSNFHESNLTLDQVSAQTGVNQRRIANSIMQAYGCNFKTYVNQIRINESKRLLKETDLHIGEIAYKVGFSSQSHFNRVFKGIAEINPSEYREQL